VSQVAAGRKNQLRLEVYGEKQSAWWDSESPEQLVCGHRDTPNQVAIRGAAGFSRDEVLPYMDYPAGHVEGFADSFKMQMRAIYSKVAGAAGAPLFATVEDGDMEVRLCEAILASHTARRWKTVAGTKRSR
jgi:predicted dehydrogenase